MSSLVITGCDVLGLFNDIASFLIFFVLLDYLCTYRFYFIQAYPVTWM